MDAADFAGRCLEVLDTVQSTHEAVTILKSGRPIARLVPICSDEADYPQRGLAGTVRIVGDLVAPTPTQLAWNSRSKPETR